MDMPKFPKVIVEKAKRISGKRARVIVDHLLKHGTITTEDLRNHGYTDPVRAIREVRDQGLPLEMFWTRDSAGRKIGGYRFGEVAAIRSLGAGGTVKFKCLWCGQPLEVTGDRRGKRVRCPGCKARTYVPVILPLRKNPPGRLRPEKGPRRQKVEQAVEIHVRLARAFDAARDEQAELREEEYLLPLYRTALLRRPLRGPSSARWNRRSTAARSWSSRRSARARTRFSRPSTRSFAIYP
jgi:hypothetical protein